MSIASRILVPVDLSDFSARAVTYASDLARLTNASMTVMNVVNDVFPYFDFFPTDYASTDLIRAMSENAHRVMTLLVEQHAPDIDVQIVVDRGYPATRIVQRAQRDGAELIVMATHGHSGIEQALLGSVTERVLRKAHCPVLVVR